MVRLALIADPHANLHALEAVLESVAGEGVDAVLCLGDLVGYGAFPLEVVERLRRDGIRSVRGNHDDAVVRGDFSWFNPYAAEAGEWTRRTLGRSARGRGALAFLEGLPLRLDLGPVSLFHGAPWDPLCTYVEPGDGAALRRVLATTVARAVVLGHTHVPLCHRAGPRLVANPGGVGQPRDGDRRAAYGVMEIGEGGGGARAKAGRERMTFEVRRVEYDVEAAAEAIRGAGLPERLAARLDVGL